MARKKKDDQTPKSLPAMIDITPGEDGQPRGRGQPTKYDPRFCDVAIRAGMEGKSRAWIAAELGVVRQTLHNWEREHPEFLDAMEQAQIQAQRWWEDRGQSGMNEQHFKAAVWSRSMSARFPNDWRESTDINMNFDFTNVPTDKLQAYVDAGSAIFAARMAGRKG